MEIKYSQKLSWRLLTYVFACSSFLAILTTISQLYFMFKEDVKRINNNISIIEKSYLKPVAKAVYHIDDNMLMTLLDGALNFDDIDYIMVSLVFGDKTIVKSRGNDLTSKNITRKFTLKYLKDSGEELILGTMKVDASFDGVYERLWDKIFILLVTNAVKAFISAICIFLIFQFFISRHLIKIAKAVSQMDFQANERNFLISLDRRAREKHKYDELDMVVNNINEMWSKLSQEIYDRRQSEAKLIQSETRFKKMIEKSPLPMVITDQNQDISFFNDKFTELFGYTLNDFSTAENWWFTAYPDEKYRAKVQQAWIDAIEKSELENSDIEMQVWDITIKDRTTRTCEFFMMPLEDFSLIIMNDITEKIKVEMKIKESEELFRALFEQAGGYCMILQPTENGIPNILDANAAACQAHGYTRNEMIGRPVADLDDEEGKRLCIERTKIIMSGKPFIIETNHVRKDGSVFPVAVFANLVKFTSKPPLIVTTEFDITDIKKAEAERLLLARQLQQAQKMESIGNLAGGIAHDFNNILFPIVGMSELLMEDLPKNSQQYEFAERIFKGGIRGSNLVKQILAFSRKSEHKLIPVRIQQILKEVIKLIRSTIPSFIEIEHDIQQNCGPVMADPTQIHQIAMNIITNAYHALENKGGKISIELKERFIAADEMPDSTLEFNRYVVMSISDTGHGMSSEIMAKIFEPYFTTKEQEKGTGLGLAVVYGIVKEHKGEIKVNSQAGKGTTFNIYLPLMEDTSETAAAEKLKTDQSGNERILIVDDEDSIVRLEKLMLERLGYHVSSHTSSIDALAAFKAHPENFDLVITDMTMPNMTGDQLAKEIQSIRPDIPVIICTGFSEKINKVKVQAFGIKGLLMKPVGRSDMAQMVREVLDDLKDST